MTKDTLYKDEKLVAIYDSINKWGDDSEFYMNIAGDKQLRILDAGCGTGMLTIKLAEKKHLVTGVDPSAQMIKFAKKKRSSDLVKWEVSSLEEYKSFEKYDLVVMTGHAFQCLIKDSQIIDAFKSVSNLLSPNGTFVFETRNPSIKPWDAWNRHDSRKSVKLKNNELTIYHDLISAENGLVSFGTYYNLKNGTKLYSESTLRFTSPEEIIKLSKKAGLNINFVYGNWDRSEFNEKSSEIIISFSRGRKQNISN